MRKKILYLLQIGEKSDIINEQEFGTYVRKERYIWTKILYGKLSMGTENI